MGNQSPADETHLYLTITDPALNIDPTSADAWIFDLSAIHASADALTFASNHTDNTGGNNAITLAERGDMGFSDNGKLGNSTNILGVVDGHGSVIMTENAANSGVFESWSTNGTSQLVTVDEVGGDKKSCFHIWWK